jgi:PBP1b-binding outer membrane lipoprotein LpoB
MFPTKLAALACCAPALVLLSCAAPKASVAEAPAPETQPVEKTAPSEPSTPAMQEDGIRLPDMLSLPNEDELRSAVSPPNQTPESGAVIARPPAEPPKKP